MMKIYSLQYFLDYHRERVVARGQISTLLELYLYFLD